MHTKICIFTSLFLAFAQAHKSFTHLLQRKHLRNSLSRTEISKLIFVESLNWCICFSRKVEMSSCSLVSGTSSHSPFPPTGKSLQLTYITFDTSWIFDFVVRLYNRCPFVSWTREHCWSRFFGIGIMYRSMSSLHYKCFFYQKPTQHRIRCVCLFHTFECLRVTKVITCTENTLAVSLIHCPLLHMLHKASQTHTK